MADREKVLTQLVEIGIGLDMAGYHNDAQCVRDALAMLREPARGWISVKERMPKRGNTCLVWLRGGGMTFMVFDGNHFVGGSAYSDDRITHWMLLPGAPEEEVSGDD